MQTELPFDVVVELTQIAFLVVHYFVVVLFLVDPALSGVYILVVVDEYTDDEYVASYPVVLRSEDVASAVTDDVVEHVV